MTKWCHITIFLLNDLQPAKTLQVIVNNKHPNLRNILLLTVL